MYLGVHQLTTIICVVNMCVCVFYRRYQVVKLLYTIVYTRARRTIMDHRALESSALAGPCLTPGNLRGVAQNPQLRPFTLRS